jgi:hypothetical protein
MAGPGAAPARASKELPLRLHGVSFAAALVLSAAGLAITLTQVFNLRLIGFRPISAAFHALVIGLFGVIALVAFSARSRPARRVSGSIGCSRLRWPGSACGSHPRRGPTSCDIRTIRYRSRRPRWQPC